MVLIEQTISRLETYSKRLRNSVSQAVSLRAAFGSLNESEEWRKAIAGTRVAPAANLFQHAALRELILIIVRVFDRPGRALETSDKVSFPVISMWLQRDEIRDQLTHRARNWFEDGYLADQNEKSVLAAIGELDGTLTRLAVENPNRQRLLRDFRDEFLAHELDFEIPRDKPLFGHIYEMVDEIRRLGEATGLAVEGSETAWNFLDEDMRESADELWKTVAARRR